MNLPVVIELALESKKRVQVIRQQVDGLTSSCFYDLRAILDG